MASQRQEPATRELPSDLPTQQRSEHPTGGAPPNHPEGHPSSNEHPENAPAVRVAAAPNGEAVEVLPGKEAGRSPSVATHPSPHTNDVGAVNAVNEPTEVDPNLQARATSVNGEPKQMATTGKEERASSQPLFPFVASIYTGWSSIDAADGGTWRRPKAVENRKARGQGRESCSERRAQRAGGDPGAAKGFHQGTVTVFFHSAPGRFPRI